MSNKKFAGANNPLGGDDTPPPVYDVFQADRDIYGGEVTEIPRSGIVKAIPIDIMNIRPDLAQPRRVVPMRVRGEWRGDARGAGDVLARWKDEAERLLGSEIDLSRRFEQVGEGMDIEQIHPIADDYLALVALAGSIRRDGLVNPITVIPQAGGSFLIEGGERRWWAYQLLKSVYEGADKYASIPAVKVDGKDAIWRQAAENGVRRPLNAIGIARQLALLIMDMWRGRDGVNFDDYEFFDHDQKFYAQVKNGQAFSILKGQMERVLAVTGLKSKAQVAHYRALLSIPADVWDEADMQNWTEFRIREVIQASRQPERFTVVNHTDEDERFTTVNLSNENERLTTVNPSQNSPFKPVNHPVITGDNGHSNSQYQPPAPTPTPRPVYNPPMVDDDDDVFMDDDGGAPIINRPFGHDVGDYRPSDAPYNPPKDPRYVQAGSLLNHFLAMLVGHADTYRYKLAEEVVTLRDLSPDSLRRAVAGLDEDEASAWLGNLMTAVTDQMSAIHDQMTKALDEAWGDLQHGA